MRFLISVPRSLKTRIVLLVAVPTIIELFLVGKLWHLQSAAEHSLQSAQHYTQVLNALNGLNVQALESNADFMGAKIDKYNVQDVLAQVKKRLHSIDDPLEQLRKLTDEDPEAIVLLNSLVQVRDNLASTLRDNAQRLLFGESNDEIRRQASRKLNSLGKNAIAELVRLQKDVQDLQYRRYAESLQIKNEETAVLVNLAIANAVFGLIAVFYLSSAASKRLQSLLTNVRKYAANQPLSLPRPGTDEIASIEDAFYNAVQSLRSAHRKERAFINESHDPIIFLGPDLRILFANESAINEIDMFVGLDLSKKIRAVEETKTFLKQVQSGEARTCQIELLGRETRHAILSAVWEPDERSYFCIVHDITERIKIEQMRSDLVSMFTHDLKSPLTALNLNLDLVSSEPLSEKQNEKLKKAQISVSRMSRLVFDLLDLYKTEAGMMQFNAADFDVQLLVKSVVDEFQEIAESLQVSISIQSADNAHLSAHADSEASRRVITNLLGNAIKFSSKGTRVDVAIQRANSMIEVSVKDAGPGIRPEDLPRLFERFHQFSVGPNARIAALGSGLGLAICKIFAEKQGGAVLVDSAVGQGSTFTFLLPENTHS
jgi:signal transduction histidine kinase